MDKLELFVDMDGVLTNWEGHFRGIFSVSANILSAKEIHDRLQDTPTFYSSMPWLKAGKELWEYVKPFNPTILTAPSEDDHCKEHKKIWLGEHLPKIPFIIEASKFLYAGSNRVLIDDTEKKIDDWVKHGGIGILHKNNDETIKKLESLRC